VSQRLEKDELAQWLKTIAGSTILSISLVGQVADLETNITDPLKLSGALSQDVGFLETGPYLVEYVPSTSEEDTEQDLAYESFAMAITLKAQLKNRPGKFFGGYDALIKELAQFEYFSTIKRGPAGPIGSLLILLPKDPASLSQLSTILERYSVFYSFPDGSGTLNVGNVKMGRGIQIEI